MPHQAVNTTMSTPGSSPPRNIFSIVTLFTLALATLRFAIVVLAIIEYRITGRHGGNKSPSAPEPVNKPTASRSEYRAERSTGRSSPPSARIVTPDAPVKEVKNAQTSAVTIAGPP